MQQALTTDNNLFPVFLKLEQMRLLIVGGGVIGLEKLETVLNNCPATHINLVATQISDEIKSIAAGFPNLILHEKPFEPADLDNAGRGDGRHQRSFDQRRNMRHCQTTKKAH